MAEKKSAVSDDAVKKARRVLARYDGVLIADSVGLGKIKVIEKLEPVIEWRKRERKIGGVCGR